MDKDEKIITPPTRIVTPKFDRRPPAGDLPIDGELLALLAAERTLCEQLKEVLASGRWFITMHAKIKDSPPDDLRHHQTHHNYPVEDLRKSLDHVKEHMLPDARAKSPSARDWR